PNDIRVEDFDFDAQLGSILTDMLIVFWQGHGAEDLGLDFAAHVHSGTMDDQDLRHNVYLMCLTDVLFPLPALALAHVLIHPLAGSQRHVDITVGIHPAAGDRQG